MTNVTLEETQATAREIRRKGKTTSFQKANFVIRGIYRLLHGQLTIRKANSRSE